MSARPWTHQRVKRSRAKIGRVDAWSCPGGLAGIPHAQENMSKKMAIPHRYSIAEARNHLPRLIHEAEKGLPVELTRWGKPVAVLLSVQEYERAVQGKSSFWEALSAYRSRADLDEIDVDEVFAGVRDTSSGPQNPW